MAAADFIRLALLEQSNTFTFETVLSHPSKVSFLQRSKEMGYKNYLYFICTIHPSVNLSRVVQRVRLGGHDVPPAKIVNRYMSSLELLPALIPHTHRTYLMDNSAENADIKFVAEIENGQTFIQRSQDIPWWVNEYVIKNLFI
jgi:predicted ABC-type ATPase